MFAPLAPAAALVPGTNCVGGVCTVTFVATGSPQSWAIPSDVGSVEMTIAAGSGGNAANGTNLGGAGGKVTATLPVYSGQTLSIVVGAVGANGVVGNAAAAGGYGGGGSAGTEQGVSTDPGGSGGGGSFVFNTNGPTLLAAAGGGGGAPGGSATVGSGGIGGAGGDAAPPSVVGPAPGSPATTSAAGAGGPALDAQGVAGVDGNGPASADAMLGNGGAGGNNLTASGQGTAGGGGGGFFGGGGGGTAELGMTNGAGGGGSGFMSSNAMAVTPGTNTGDGWVTIVYAEPQASVTSGVLRDAATGEAIPNSCVAFSPVSAPWLINYTSVDLGGNWSLYTNEIGPFNVAFYTTANGDCSQPILPNPVPSWYANQALTGTNVNSIVPPGGVTSIPAGASGIVACLGATALPTGPCAPPAVSLSGTVVTTGNVPLANVCVIAIGSSGVVLTLTDALGRWSLSGLPNEFSVLLGFVPGSGPADQPCNTEGPPPVPAAGSLQPEFYNNVWLNLADPTLFSDPQSWALARGGTLITQPTSGISACLTTTAGDVVPRPACTAVADGGGGSGGGGAGGSGAGGSAISGRLPATGIDIAPTLTAAILLILLGLLPLTLRQRRRHA